ncbi:GHMP kinase [Octadecabacter sp. 1_MG-2023]|uniref:GHMP family kinase ATP-binding protein n=1 Tax=unclassified Octadecabacter TaxID=196158 RepID=UPI001C0A03A9|nr:MULTISPECIES: GHMP kinase [unclassified Octadecabacter]MBU2994063.1 GHMP kinase [Octadecabacter sp. B2R22]MDO6736083.1 GHMP kinase [Octadecabacter sp. 1_MG-2023]
MIITQTPYRVSFAGGGTDLPAFYEHEYGAVLSMGVAQHMYVTVSPRFDKTTRMAYTRVEIADGIDNLEHTIAREALRMTGLGEYLEITTVGDVPAGTGMGSSSSLAVGLLNALYAYKGQVTSPGMLAEKACEIEIDILGKPIGRQDQYAAAYGGVNYIRFNPDHSVDVEPVPCDPAFLDQIEKHTLLLYTDQSRDADVILKKQSEGSANKLDVLREMRDLAGELRMTMGGAGNLADFGRILHEGWLLKRSLGFGITNSGVDEWYETARAHGAMGGKLLGAGGGGFLLVMAPPETHDAIRAACGHPRELPFNIDRRGSRVIFISDRYAF